MEVGTEVVVGVLVVVEAAVVVEALVVEGLYLLLEHFWK